jgi:hypothetical protein
MKDLIKKIFFGKNKEDDLFEGLYAHEYSTVIKDQIRKSYEKRWHPEQRPTTPNTHPWLFDPCDPPEGWLYDPYYETWIKLNQ